MLTAREREQVRLWLLRERERAARAADRAAAEAGELLRRVGERDPCVYLSPAAREEDEELEGRARRTGESQRMIDSIEESLRLLEHDTETFGVCDECGGTISMDRIEVVPYTRVCRVCADRR